MGDTNNLNVVLVILSLVVGYFFIFCYRKVRQNRKNQPQVEQKEKPELPPLASIELTEKQLAEYNGTREDGRILIAYKGDIYDVSSGLEQFGSKGALACVAGKNFSAYLNHTLENERTKLGFVERWEVLLNKNYKKVGVLVDEDVHEKSELKEDKEKKEEEGKEKAKEKDDNLKDKDTLDCKQENVEIFNISDDAELGESMNESINETIIDQTLMNTTINMMKSVVPDEMLDNELPTKTLTEEVA